MSPRGVELVALAAGVAAVLGLVCCLILSIRLRTLRRAYSSLVGAAAGGGFVDVVRQQQEQAQAVERSLLVMRDEVTAVRAQLADSLKNVAVVRYDAFGDAGGRLSYSAALLDDAGHGLVLTSINGRSETRSYAKGVQSGSSDQSLSPEESEAVTRAIGRQREPVDNRR